MNRKPILILVLALLLVAGCSGSGDDGQQPDTTASPTPTETATAEPTETAEPTATPAEPPAEAAEVEDVVLLPELNFRLGELIGQKVWSAGFYADGGFTGDGIGFLVANFDYLKVGEVMPHHSYARLAGGLPPEDLTGAEILVYGEVTLFDEEFEAHAGQQTPIITVENYHVLDPGPPPAGWEDLYSLELASVRIPGTEGAIPSQDIAEVRGTQASDCDRALVIGGGVNRSANYTRYGWDIIEKYKALTGIGFTPDNVDVLYYSGTPTSLTVGGQGIVDGAATMANIRAAIDKYKREMEPSCTLIIMVTDHGTGYNDGQWYQGARPDLTGAETGGKTYAEASFTVDAKAKVVDRTADITYRGALWRYYKDKNGKAWFSKKVGTQWVTQGADDDGDGFMEEHECGQDLNGDGDATDNYGLSVSYCEARIEWIVYYDNAWDTDKDGADDVRMHWDGSKYVFKRLKEDGTWAKMGEDTDGDYDIDSADGGVDWNLDGDKGDQVGFHEGINLLGSEVLWDDQMAGLLKPLSDNGIHIMVEMQQCFSGGFVGNLNGIVESAVAASAEDKKSWARTKDPGTYAGASWEDTWEVAFAKNLTGLDIDSWGRAYDRANTKDDDKWRADGANPDEKNDHQVGGNPFVASETTYFCKDGMYNIFLRIPDSLAGKVCDFEFVTGHQQPRWEVTLEDGMGFPDGLPAGLDSELIPGGIRVFATEPIAASTMLIKLKAPTGDCDHLRIDLTDANHNKVGYILPGTQAAVSLQDEREMMSASVSARCIAEETADGCKAKLFLDCRALDMSAREVPIRRMLLKVDGVTKWEQSFGGEGQDPSPMTWGEEIRFKDGECGRTYEIEFSVINAYGQVLTAYATVTCADLLSSGGSGGGAVGGGFMPCFAGDTLVLMANGSAQPIMDVQVGQVVMSFDVDADQAVVKPVVATGSGKAGSHYLINGSLKVTPPHPFRTVDRGWVEIAGLAVGDTIIGPEGTAEITSIEVVEAPLDIYNMRIEDTGCFFVSASGEEFLLVHQGF